MTTVNEKTLSDLVRRAEQGNSSAQCNLGVIYGNGNGVRQDYAEAASWFHLAADQGNIPAQCNLGVLYRDGHGVPRDYAEAANWFRLAADQGVAPAQFNLGVLYRDGRGVPQNAVEACKWLNLAVAHAGANRQAKYSEIREKLVAKLSADQIMDAQRLADEWKPKGQDKPATGRRASAHVPA